MSWPTKEILVEAKRNLEGSRVRTVLFVLLCAALMGAVSWAELDTTQNVREFESEYRRLGGYVAVVGGSQTISASRCEALSRRDDVVASGGVRLGGVSDTVGSPGTFFQLADITPGVMRVWLPDQTPSEEQTAGRWIVGAAAAEELSLNAGRALPLAGYRTGVVGAVVSTDDRSPEAMRWIMATTPPVGFVSTCWVEFTKDTFGGGIAALWAGFPGAGPDIEVNAYRDLDEFSFDPVSALTQRPQRNAWFAIGIVLAFAVWIGIWFRRSETALYRAIGTTRLETMAMASVESTVALVAGSTIGLVWSVAIFSATHAERLAVDQVAIAGRNVGSALLLALVMAPLGAAFIGWGSVADQLKDRN